MPIDTLHPDYEKMAPLWKKCRDTIAGAEVIKNSDNSKSYLPVLSGQDNADYRGYVARAYFLGAAGRTVQGLSGAVFRKDPLIDAPESKDIHEWLGDVTGANVPIDRFAQVIFDEVLSVGRVGVYVSLPVGESQTAVPYLSAWKAESIINWGLDYSGDVPQLAWVVLKEQVPAASEDPFGHETVEQYRHLYLDAAGIFTVQLYREEEGENKKKELVAFGPAIQPNFRGQRLDFIPFDLLPGIDTEKPPLLDLVNANLHHYILSADYNWGLHFTGLPTPYVFGVPDSTQIKMGSSVAITSIDPQTTAGFLEFKGEGLKTLEAALDKVEHYIAYMGSRLLAQPRKAVEAAETHRLRQGAEQVTVMTLAQEVSQALTRQVGWALSWQRINAEVTITLNSDIVDARLEPADIQALLSAWTTGAISKEVLFENFQRGGIIREDLTFEAEEEKIKAGEMDDVGEGVKDEEEEVKKGTFNPADNFRN